MITFLTICYNVLLVLVGVNALIIVHEFGHFIVARACGVRCEKFYIWFDFWGLRFFRFKWGDTEYGLGVFPLGGYVKMLGQEDDPNKLREQLEKMKEAEARGEVIDSPLFAKDSYLAKSVPQRMAIIVAGVVMNFLFAIVCATAAYMIGFTDMAPVIGNVVPGSPAWYAGLQVGDRIESINNKKAYVFFDINMSMIGGKKGVNLGINRLTEEGERQRIDQTIIPRKRAYDIAPNIGVSNCRTLELVDTSKADPGVYPVYTSLKKLMKETDLILLKRGNLAVYQVNDVPIKNYRQYQEEQLKAYGKPITCGITLTQTDIEKEAAQKGIDIKRLTGSATLPPLPMKEIGVRFAFGPITGVLPNSEAAQKGIKVGDIIVSIDGDAEIDPIKLPELLLQKVNAEKESVEIVLKSKDGNEKTVTVTLAKKRIIPDMSALSMKDPLASDALGIAWTAEPVIAGVSEKIADIAEGLVGSRVVSWTFVNGEPIIISTRFAANDEVGHKITKIGDMIDMPYITRFLLQLATAKKETKIVDGKKVKNDLPLSIRLEVDLAGTPATFDLPILDSTDWFNTDRGLILNEEKSFVKAGGFVEAVYLGTNKMIDSSLSVFKTLNSLINGQVSVRGLGGPILIVQKAWEFANSGLGKFLIFLCLIGANLAVLNILPIPVLDGGHLVFLLYEGIFRKPPPESVLIVLSYLGLAAILTLMVWAVSLDIGCVKRW